MDPGLVTILMAKQSANQYHYRYLRFGTPQNHLEDLNDQAR